MSFAQSTHKVRAGENDHTIARKHGVSVSELHKANSGVKWERLQINQSLKIPGKATKASATKTKSVAFPKPNSIHKVTSGESDWSISRKYGLTVAQLHAMNPGVSFQPLKQGASLKVHSKTKVVAQKPAAKPAPKPDAKVAPKAAPKVTQASYVPPARAGITTMNAEISGKDIAIRAAASSTSGVLMRVNTGVIGRVVDRQGDWYRLTFTGGTTGWVAGSSLKNTAKPTTALPSAKRAPVRTASKPASAGKSTTAAKDLIASALSLQGIRYRWGGTSRAGFDCSGFVQHVYRQHGVSLPRTSREQATRGTSVPRNALRAGDLVFFITRGSVISHVGMYIGNNRFVHASSGGGRVRVDSLTGYYAKRYAGARRVSAKFQVADIQDEFDRWAATLPVEEVPEGIDPEPDPVVATNRGTDTVAP